MPLAQELPPPSGHTSGPSFSLVSTWIKDCQTSHEECAQLVPVGPRKFRRILDIGQGDTETIRLAKAEEVPIEADYMTLSHCWGNTEILKLTADNYESMRREIALNGLPKTFKDAIDIARNLGCRFVWIDSLCILQNSVEDWRSQAAVMGEIYQGSVCNLAATAARDGHDGMLMHVQRNPAYIERLHVHVPDIGQLSFEDIGRR